MFNSYLSSNIYAVSNMKRFDSILNSRNALPVAKKRRTPKLTTSFGFAVMNANWWSMDSLRLFEAVNFFPLWLEFSVGNPILNCSTFDVYRLKCVRQARGQKSPYPREAYVAYGSLFIALCCRAGRRTGV
jgi:hypothetical protein